MMPGHVNTNPLNLARESLNMASQAKGQNGAMFQNVSLALMGVMAMATASQMLLQLWRELNRHDKCRER